MVFADFERAFDILSRKAIWAALDRKHVPEKIVRIIKALYEDTESVILHNGNLSDPIKLNTGVRQGCPLSPLLFVVALDEVMRKANRTARGIS